MVVACVWCCATHDLLQQVQYGSLPASNDLLSVMWGHWWQDSPAPSTHHDQRSRGEAVLTPMAAAPKTQTHLGGVTKRDKQGCKYSVFYFWKVILAWLPFLLKKQRDRKLNIGTNRTQIIDTETAGNDWYSPFSAPPTLTSRCMRVTDVGTDLPKTTASISNASCGSITVRRFDTNTRSSPVYLEPCASANTQQHVCEHHVVTSAPE